MPFKMTHTDERYLQCIRDAFRITQSYQKRPGKTGTLRDGNGANIAPVERSLLKRGLRHSFNDLNMTPRCEFGNHSAKAPVNVVLRRDDIGEHPSPGIKHRRGRLVARGFDA